MENYIFFDNYMIKTYEINDETLFEVYSVGSAIGFSRWDGKTLNYDGTYKMFPYKSRIDSKIIGLGIETLPINDSDYLDMDNLIKLLAGCHGSRKNSFVDWLEESYGISTFGLYSTTKEEAMLNTLEGFLEPLGYTLLRQVRCGNYRIDAVIPELNLAIEYDEDSHSNYDKRADRIRESFIRLHYDLIRVTDSHKIEYNLGLITARIIEISTSENGAPGIR